MDSSLALSDSHRLAHAFLALGDDAAAEPARPALARRLTAVAAVLALSIAAPLTWMAPASRSLAKLGDQPAATLSSSKAGLAAADDEDDAGE